MRSNQLANSMLGAPDCEVGCILNVSTPFGDKTFFGTFDEINHLPTKNSGLQDVVLTFTSSDEEALKPDSLNREDVEAAIKATESLNGLKIEGNNHKLASLLSLREHLLDALNEIDRLNDLLDSKE